MFDRFRRPLPRALIAGAMTLTAATATAVPAAAADDGRHFELISKGLPSGRQAVQMAPVVVPGGDQVVYMANQNDAGSSVGYPPSWVARRDATGWTDRQLALPNAKPTTANGFDSVRSQWVDGNLLISSARPLDPASPDGSGGLFEIDASTLAARRLVAGDRSGTVLGTDPATREVLIETSAALVPEAESLPPNASKLYAILGERTRLISRLPGGAPNPQNLTISKEASFVSGSQTFVNDEFVLAPIAGGRRFSVSADGRRAFFTAGPYSEWYSAGPLYRNDAKTGTVAISASQRNADRGSLSRAIFNGASSDGDIVFFTASQPLKGAAEGPALYRYVVSTRALERLTPSLPAAAPESADFPLDVRTAWASPDGSTIVFVATNAFDPDAVEGDRNAYAWRDGQLRFVADLGSDGVVHRISRNGDFAVLSSSANVAGASTGDNSQLFRYDWPRDELRCASCRSDGSPNEGVSEVRATTPNPLNSVPISAPRGIADDGHVFFTAFDRLVPADPTRDADAYEFTGSELRLLSNGEGQSFAVDNSDDGSAVYINSTAALSPEDVDGGEYDLFVRRSGASPSTPPSGQEACNGDACQAPATSPASPPVPRSDAVGLRQRPAPARAGSARCPEGRRDGAPGAGSRPARNGDRAAARSRPPGGHRAGGAHDGGPCQPRRPGVGPGDGHGEAAAVRVHSPDAVAHRPLAAADHRDAGRLATNHRPDPQDPEPMIMRKRHDLIAVLCALAGATAVATPAHAEFGLAAPPRVAFHKPLAISFPQAVGVENYYSDPRVRRGLFRPLTPDTQAGGHPDLSIDLDFKTTGAETGFEGPDGEFRDLIVDLPPGFTGIPPNYPTCEAATVAESPARCQFGAQVGVVAFELGEFDLVAPVYNVRAGKDEPAQLVFTLAGVTVTAVIDVRTETDSGVTARLEGVAQVGLRALRMTLWGDPSDATHDGLRWSADGYVPLADDGGGITRPSGLPPKPFITAPARCDAPLSTRVRTRSWTEPDRWLDYRAQTPRRTGCDRLAFEPSLTVTPGGKRAGEPVGVDVELAVPQPNSVEAVATPQLQDATVTLPEGVAISPGAADGLAACSDGELAVSSRTAESCPDASRVGTTTIESPLLDEPLDGSVYLGEQRSADPASGDMYRLFVTAYARGVRIKLVGHVAADPVTGRLTATFRQNPELAFSRLRLQLKDGPRALLTNPSTCGAGTARLDATSYAGNAASDESGYVVDQGCPTGAFSPSSVGGTLDPFAGRLSPFTTTFGRPDGQADLANVRLDLPPGLLGSLSTVPVCAEAQAAAGTCDVGSRVGSTQVSVGTGSAPFGLPGSVFLAGPYEGAPFSLSIVVPAKAGPLDLGLVVVRAPLVVNAARAQVSAPVDALPQIVGGVPLHYRSISVNLDRPGFTFNATNCSAAEVVATLTSTSGLVSRQATRYQPDSCDRLKLRPALKLRYGGSLRKGANPKLTANLSQAFGESGLRKVSVTLPKISSLAPENAGTLCSVAQFEARACPAGSRVGQASATTPALPAPLAGPVYLVQGRRTTASGRTVRTLPKLFLDLEGSGVPLDLVADTSVVSEKLVTTFANVPDAPISSFKLEIDGGRRGILTAVQDPCQPKRTATARFDGQNGARTNRKLQIAAPGCGIRVSARTSRRGVTATVGNIAPGKVTLRGKGLRLATKTVRSGDRTALTARWEGKARRTRVRVTFDPKAKGAKTQTLTRRVTP